MAKFNYDELEQVSKVTSNKEDKSKVGYFNSLKNDGDEAIVRFVYSNPSQFDLLVVHKVKVGDFYRYISCLRNGLEPVEKCPLCAKEEKVISRFFVKMVEYVRDEKGNIVPRAVVWDRPANFSQTIKNLIDEYGDLSTMVFKVKRKGAKGDMKTSYDCYPANKNVYKEDLYPRDFSAFNDFDLSHHSYYELNYDEVNYFVTTGEIPQREKPQDDAQANQVQNNQQYQGANVTGGYGNSTVPPYNTQPQGQYQPQPNNYNMAENNPFPQGQPNVGYQQPQQPNPYQGYPQGQPQPQQAQQQPQQNQSGRRVYSY